ncbi:hypothetical protein [Bacillus sp. NPDC077027]|uniref:hypothetical protein n=1 Tax=Bacillus sp. NPDC077027 TaxID=3390548 RepID=UPI003CFF3532
MEEKISYEEKEQWETVWSEFLDYAESCYFRWLNCDNSLTDSEEKVALEFKQKIDSEELDEGGLLEIAVPPEHDISPEEFEIFVKVMSKFQNSGILDLVSVFTGCKIREVNY